MPLDSAALDVSTDLRQPLNLTPQKSGLADALSGSIEQQLPGAVAKETQQAQQKQDVAGATVKELDAERERRASLRMPTPPMPTRPPEPPHTDPTSAWGSLAMAVAMMGSAFTRQPFLNSLNSAAAVMNAFHKNDSDGYKVAFDRWKAESDYGIKLYEYQRDAYKDAIDMIGHDEKGALAKLRVLSAALNDDPVHRLAEAGNVSAIGDLARMRDDAHEKVGIETDRLRQHGEITKNLLDAGNALRADPNNPEKQQAYAQAQQQAKDFAMSGGHGVATADARLQQENDIYARLKQDWENDPGNVGKTLTGADEARLRAQAKGAMQGKEPPTAHSASEVQYWVNVLHSGGHLPPGLSRTASGSQLVQEIMKSMAADGGMSSGDFIANAASVKADDRSLTNMTKMADAATSFERTASQNFDLALRLAKGDPEGKLPVADPAHGRPAAIPTDLGPFFNRWIMTGQTQFGDVDVPPYVTAMLTGANEYAKIMSGSTGAQGSTVDSRREAAELFSPYLSKGQIDRVVAVAKTDMGNRKQSLYGQIDDIKARLRSAGSNEPTATQGQRDTPKSDSAAPQPKSSAALPTDLPPAAGHPDGTTVKQGGKVIAVIRNGQWAEP